MNKNGMKLFVLVLGVWFSVIPVASQGEKYLVWLSDKNKSSYSIDNPEYFLSQRAIQRRLKQNIAIDSLDLPVNQAYIDQVESLGVKVVCKSRWLNTITIASDSLKLIQNVGQLPFVDSMNISWIEPTMKSSKIKLESLRSTEFDYGMSLPQISMHNGQLMHRKGFTGKGLVIAILDAGFYKVDELDGFENLRMNNQIIETKNFVTPGASVYTTHTHGMAVLSIIGGSIPGFLEGTAPDAKFLLYRTEDSDSEYPVEMDYWIAGAELADSMGADIINSSLGYYVFDHDSMSYQLSDLDGKTMRVTRGADIAASKGMLVVSSAGNEGNKTWKKITGPADGFNVLAVGSVAKDSTYSVFSSVGPSADGRVKPDVVATGTQTVLQNSINTAGTGNGTSFSSPIMAGMSACLWQAVPDLSSAQLRQLIIENAHLFNAPTDNLGYGIVDIYRAWLTTKNEERFMSESSIRIYPSVLINSDELIVEHDSNEEMALHVYNISGKMVYSRVLGKKGDQVVLLPHSIKNGVYLLEALTHNEVRNFKLLLKR